MINRGTLEFMHRDGHAQPGSTNFARGDDRASRSFRTQLGKMNPATHHVLYIYSSMTAFINIAFSQCNFSEGGELNTLSTCAVAFDLLNGSGKHYS